MSNQIENPVVTPTQRYRSRNREKLNRLAREYYVRTKETRRTVRQEWHREYRRKYRIGGVKGIVTKRARPDMCEICGGKPDKLSYHHWDDTNPKLGVWICRRCHWMVGDIENGNLDIRMKRYQDLKATIISLDSVGMFNILVDNCLPIDVKEIKI